MAKLKLADVVTKVVDLLDPLTSEERQRVVKAALTLVGEAGEDTPAGHRTQDLSEDEEVTDLPARARTWMKHNSVSLEGLERTFHVASDGVEFIGDVPGKNDKERTYNAYVLTGVRALLATGDATFSDRDARALCESAGCYNKANHAAYIRDKGNQFTGSKDKGWTLTAPGLKHAASLVNQTSH